MTRHGKISKLEDYIRKYSLAASSYSRPSCSSSSSSWRFYSILLFPSLVTIQIVPFIHDLCALMSTQVSPSFPASRTFHLLSPFPLHYSDFAPSLFPWVFLVLSSLQTHVLSLSLSCSYSDEERREWNVVLLVELMFIGHSFTALFQEPSSYKIYT